MPAMNREIENAMRRCFGAWMRLRDAVAHGNEYERERLIIRSEEIADSWEASAYQEEWEYLTALVRAWHRAPQTMQAVTTAAQAGQTTELTEVEVRSLTQVQLLLDPQFAGREGWQSMHDQLSAMDGRQAAGAGDESDAPLRARLSVIYDQSVWPELWIDYECAAQTDKGFWAHQEQVFDTAFQQAKQLTTAR